MEADQQEHFDRLIRYFRKSSLLFTFLLGGSKHFGFYPADTNVSENEAQSLMQDLIGEKLKLTGSQKVLDAGCGEGIVSVYLARKYNCSIEGVTVVPFEIEKAKKLASKNHVSHKVKYSLMDYSALQFGDCLFDAVYTIEALSHSTDIQKTLGELYRVLRIGGRIALFEYSLADDDKFSSSEMGILDNVMFASAMDSLKDFRHGLFVDLIRKIGFKDVTTEDISKNVMPSLNRLRRFLIIPYYLAKFLSIEDKCPNVTAAVEFYKMAKKDLIRYNIFMAQK